MLQQLYLIRHAQPKLGTGIPYDRVPGPPLSDTGRDEARAAGLYLAQCGLQDLFASPLDRTQETARAIADQVGLHVTVEEALAEHRSDETFDKVKTRMRDLLARVDSEPAPTVGFVTHGSPIKAMLQLLSSETIDLSKHTFDNGNHAPTAGIWRAERSGDGWRLDLVFTPAMVRIY
jgi:2,3-bisphosphoglycerate-dependent phosphoglycerate mutase